MADKKCSSITNSNSVYTTVAAIGLLCLSFGGAVFLLHSRPLQGEASIAWISAFISIANALLLYATLQSQNKGISNQKEATEKERFEATFFNLLRSHRELANEICIYRPSVTAEDISKISQLRFAGRQFFTFARIDISNIEKTLKGDQLPPAYDTDAAGQAQEYLDSIMYDKNADPQTKQNNYVQSARMSYLVNIYGMQDKHLSEYKSNKDLPYQLFEQGFGSSYEQYTRSLIHMLEFVKKSKQDIKTYIDIISSQMSKDEYEFVKLMIPTNKELLKQINDTKFYGNQFA